MNPDTTNRTKQEAETTGTRNRIYRADIGKPEAGSPIVKIVPLNPKGRLGKPPPDRCLHLRPGIGDGTAQRSARGEVGRLAGGLERTPDPGTRERERGEGSRGVRPDDAR